MLFKGNDVPRQAAMGLFWLTVAKDAVAKEGGGADDKWITETYCQRVRAGDRGRARDGASAISRTGCGAALSARVKIRVISWLDREIDDHGHVVRRLLPRPHVPVDAAPTSRSAACGDSRTWSMRMPLFFCQAPA